MSLSRFKLIVDYVEPLLQSCGLQYVCKLYTIIADVLNNDFKE